MNILVLRSSHMGANPGNMEKAAAEFLRALRGHRSQRAFARRLGYRANPMTDWEHGRRFPTASETLRAAQLVGVDVRAALLRFHPAEPPEQHAKRFAVSPWLAAIRGTTPIAHLAQRTGCSRFAVARWLSGAAEPRLPDFFRLVDAVTGRLPDLAAVLVPIDQVPSLLDRYRTTNLARRLAFEAPWTEAVLRILETRDYQELPEHEEGYVATRVGLPLDTERDCIELLHRAGILEMVNGHWRQERPLTVDTRGDAKARAVLLRHWTGIAGQRIEEPLDRDFFAYNVMSVSREDYERIRALLQRTFREIRAIVAASEPPETAAVLNLQLFQLRERRGED